MDAKTGANIKSGKLILGDKNWSFPVYDGTIGPSISELNRQEKLIQTRLDTIYDDKLDGVIDSATYERKSPEYRKQLEDVLVARRKHSDANVSYFELGSNIFELAQKAHEIYAKEALPEQKRSLLQTAFSNFTLKDEKLAPAYINGFQMVAERAKDGNWLGGRESNPDSRLQRALSYR